MEEAQTAIDRVLREDSAEARVLLAAMYMKDEDCERALPEVRAALERNPAVALASSLLGRCLMDDKRNDFPGAIEAFRRELAGDPNHFESNLYLASLLREGGQAEEALAFAERAARLRPGDVAARYSLGATYVALGRTEEAVPLLEQVASVAPDHLPTQMQLAVAYHRLGRAEDSLRARAAVGRLQAEGENRFFEGVSDALSRLLGKTAPAAEAGPAKP